MTIVFMCGDLVVNASILTLPYSDKPLPQLVDGMDGHCLQYTVTPSVIYGTMTTKRLTRQGVGGLYHTVNTLPWPPQSPILSPIKHIWDNLEWGVGYPTSLNE
ncbi:hypothetical protein TNCV_458421 [Trichonephila clavipes]|nr:hypothetical protein TNCV_458421 [Trichonephila clavipes]